MLGGDPKQESEHPKTHLHSVRFPSLEDQAKWLSEKLEPLLCSISRTHAKEKKGWCGSAFGEDGFLWLTDTPEVVLWSPHACAPTVIYTLKVKKKKKVGLPQVTNPHVGQAQGIPTPSDFHLLSLWPQWELFGEKLGPYTNIPETQKCTIV